MERSEYALPGKGLEPGTRQFHRTKINPILSRLGE
jgi:hypothetical protein